MDFMEAEDSYLAAPSSLEGFAMDEEDASALMASRDGASGAEALLGRQLANGLWDGSGTGPEPVRQARATALALLELLREGITSSHPLHGAQVKKAVEALLAIAASLTGEPQVAELALGVAWLAAAGPRTRGRIEQAAKPLAGLSGHLGNEAALRQHVDALASR
jgi:Ca-activated chloride channel family protein